MKTNSLSLVKLLNFTSSVIMGLLMSFSVSAAPALKVCDTSLQFKINEGPEVSPTELNVDQSLAKLTRVSVELQKLLEANKETLLPLALQLISNQSAKNSLSSEDTYRKILLKIEQAIKSLNSKVSFEAQINILPAELCSHLELKIEQRIASKSAQADKNALNRVDHVIQAVVDNAPNIIETPEENYFIKNSNPIMNLLRQYFPINMSKVKEIVQSFSGNPSHNKKNSINFSTSLYNHSNELQKNFGLIGLSLNISYKVIPSKIDNSLAPLKYNASLSGSFLISTPHNYQYKLDIPIPLQGSPVGNLHLNHAYFENNLEYPAIKNYVAITFENIKYSNIEVEDASTKEDYSAHTSYYDPSPKMHLYFSDEFFFNYNFESRQISLIPSLENPLRSLLINITTDGCSACSKAKLNLAVNHLILDFVPFEIYTQDPSTQEVTHTAQVVVPKVRFPIHHKSEKGGFKLSIRADGLTKKDSINILSFYLNGDSLLNDFLGGKKLANQGVNAGYEYILNQAAINAAFIQQLVKQSAMSQPKGAE